MLNKSNDINIIKITVKVFKINIIIKINSLQNILIIKLFCNSIIIIII